MKSKYLSGAALACLLLVGGGCSESSQDMWSSQPKNCEASFLSGNKLSSKAVPCSGPIDIVALANESRSEHEARFGGPYKKMSEGKYPNQVFYNGGSIRILYTKANPVVVSHIEVYPENLDFEPEAILNFISRADISVKAEPEGSPVYGYVWNDPQYATIIADSWVGNKPDKVLRIKIYGPDS